MPGRPRTLEPTVALEKAMLLFWEYGYEGTGIAKLEATLGIGRQSIYNTFGDKKSLFLKAYQHYLDTRLSSALELLQHGNTPQEKLRNLFHNSLECTSEKHFGCFIGNTIATPSGHDIEIKSITEKAIDTFLNALKHTINPLFTDEPKLNATVWNLFTLFQGIQLIAKQKSTRKNLLKAIDRNIDQLPSK